MCFHPRLLKLQKEYVDLISNNSVFDSTANIVLSSYHPEKLEYKYTSKTENNVAFSEVFYDKGWNAYIDNQPVDHFRLNYILRGLKVPAGKHSIRFEYNPKTYQTGSILAVTFGGLIYLIIGLSIFLWIRKELITKDPNNRG